MTFKELLNKYMDELDISSKELADKANISYPVISRYKTGERTPKLESSQLLNLASALEKFSIEKNIKHTKEEILENLTKAIKNEDNFNYDNLSTNLNTLINKLNININKMSKYIAFDSSHISRIKNGKTRPSDPIDFSKRVTDYIMRNYYTEENPSILTDILNISKVLTKEQIYDELFSFLVTLSKSENEAGSFLNKLDTFDLNDFIKSIKFDELKVPNISFYHIKNRNYYGLEEMKNGELDFFKGTILSKNMDDIFMCSDMPMEDMAEDIDFGKKWMFAIALSLKKGLHINIIHNLDRPTKEMFLGLESWIPIYMTGEVTPYYFKDLKNTIYYHLNYVSGTCALTGECIKDNHKHGKYYLTKTPSELKYFQEKAVIMLKKANPLMDIYTENNKTKLKDFLKHDEETKLNRKRYISTLPLFTISDDLLDEILRENKLTDEEINIIKDYKNKDATRSKKMLEEAKINDNIYEIKEEEFNNYKPYILLENLFFNKKIYYNYKQYKKHLDQTKNYKNENYSITFNEYKTFSNITITIVDNNYVIISKNENPNIHFIIRHQKLIDAIINFTPIVKE